MAGWRLAEMVIKIYEEGIRKEEIERKWGRMKAFAERLHLERR